MTREEILRRINIEENRRASSLRNAEASTTQAGKSQDILTQLYAQLGALPPEEPEEAGA